MSLHHLLEAAENELGKMKSMDTKSVWDPQGDNVPPKAGTRKPWFKRVHATRGALQSKSSSLLIEYQTRNQIFECNEEEAANAQVELKRAREEIDALKRTIQQLEKKPKKEQRIANACFVHKQRHQKYPIDCVNRKKRKTKKLTLHDLNNLFSFLIQMVFLFRRLEIFGGSWPEVFEHVKEIDFYFFGTKVKTIVEHAVLGQGINDAVLNGKKSTSAFGTSTWPKVNELSYPVLRPKWIIFSEE